MSEAFGFIERVVKSDFFFRKRPIFLHSGATCSELPSYINNVVPWSAPVFVFSAFFIHSDASRASTKIKESVDDPA